MADAQDGFEEVTDTVTIGSISIRVPGRIFLDFIKYNFETTRDDIFTGLKDVIPEEEINHQLTRPDLFSDDFMTALKDNFPLRVFMTAKVGNRRYLDCIKELGYNPFIEDAPGHLKPAEQ